MSSVPRLLEGLKSILRRRGVSYAELARQLKVSESTVKRMFSRGSLTVGRLEHICTLIDVDFFELAKECKGREAQRDSLSSEQERALADDPVLLAVFHLLLNGWTVARICDSYEIAEARAVTYLATLDRLGLIELRQHNSIRLRISRQLSSGDKGAVRNRYEHMVRDEFFSSRFDGQNDAFRFDVREISPASILALRENVERLAREFQELAERDAGLPEEDKLSVGCLVAARPWVFSVLAALRRRIIQAESARPR
jgi:transcriptional regulator with XRE-family HTH domain